MDAGLKDKVVLITGGAGGIGSELVKRFSTEGARVAIHCHKNQGAAETLSKSLPNDSVVVKGDLSDEAQVIRVFKETEEKWGAIEIFVANAGIWEAQETPIFDMTLAQWNHTLSTNLTSIFLGMREFFRGIRRHKISDPSGIVIGSSAGIYGEAGHCDYAASKAGAIYGFMLSLKNELAQIAPRGRINAICPSWVLTPMAKSFSADPKAVTKALQTVALRKVARPSDVAASALFLASPQLSGHLSGQILTLAGGMEGRVLYDPSEIDLKKA